MRSFLLSLISILMATSLFAQSELSIDDVEIVNLGDNRFFGRKTNDEKTPLDGPVRIITGFTAEYVEAEFKNGYAVGTWSYYKDKRLRDKNGYADGYMDGEQVSYYADGETVKSRTSFVKGEVEGTITRYYSNGKKEYEKTVKNRLDEGPERFYGEDGTVRSETIFKNGKAEGKSFANISSSRGDYIQTSNNKNGKLDGEYTERYTTDGKLKKKGNYANGQKDGVWEEYKEGEIPKLAEGYKDGDLVKKITYFTNGKPDTERNYKNGREDGVVKQYDQNGTIKSEKNYVNGKQIGKQMQYYASNAGNYIETSNYNAAGQKDGIYSEKFTDVKATKVEGSYLNGQKHGKWTYGYASGKLYKEEIYDNGVLKESKDIK